MHAASGGGFFDVDPPEPRPEPEFPPTPPWMQLPQDELPGRVVLDEVLHRDAATVVVLSEVRAYRTGLGLAVHWVHRRTNESAREWERWFFEGRGHPGQHDDDALRVGVRFADGTRVLPFRQHYDWNDPEAVTPPTLMMIGRGGGGPPDAYAEDLDAWLWTGTPVTGDLDVVAEWRALGIPETGYRISADVLAAAPAPRPLWD